MDLSGLRVVPSLVRLGRTALEQRRAGFLDAERYLADPTAEAEPRVLAFRTGAIGRDLLRSVLAALPAPLWPLAAAGYALLPPERAQRLEQLVADCSYWQGVRRGAGAMWPRVKAGGALILAYHALTVGGEQPSDYVLRARDFALQMAWLKLARYRVTPLDKIVAGLQQGILLPPRSVAVTFDDGYRDSCSVAFPILRLLGFPATVFLVSGMVGGVNEWDGPEWPVSGRPMLSWHQIRAMAKGGISFGAHTATHPHLTTASAERLDEEICRPRADLERELGEPPTLFAYPHGDNNPNVRAAVAEAGLVAACSTLEGRNHPGTDLMLLRRSTILGRASFARFLRALWTGCIALVG